MVIYLANTVFALCPSNSVINKEVMVYLFFPENRFDISCKLSPVETICMKYQSLFLRKT